MPIMFSICYKRGDEDDDAVRHWSRNSQQQQQQQQHERSSEGSEVDVVSQSTDSD